MKIDIRSDLAAADLDRAWTLYEESFAGLNAHAVQRHLMYRTEFDAVAADPRIQKWLAYNDDGDLVGLATYTNELDAWPLIAPEYFALRWPELYAAKAIWYCGFVAVQQNAAAANVFTAVITGMYRQAEEQHGVIALDFCSYNDMTRQIGRVIGLSLNRISNGRVHAEVADTQTFMIYETAPGHLQNV